MITSQVTFIDFLGVGAEDQSLGKFAPNWIRCHIEFDGMPGEEVLDIPVIADLPDNAQGVFADRSLHVGSFSEDQVRKLVTQKISNIQSADREEIFTMLDDIGNLRLVIEK